MPPTCFAARRGTGCCATSPCTRWRGIPAGSRRLCSRSIDPARFDPTRESIVRVEARRLRQELARCYATDGATALPVVRLNAGSYVPRLDQRSAGVALLGALPSLAVLPFLDLAGNADGPRRCNVLTEELIDALVQVPGLKVVARVTL